VIYISPPYLPHGDFKDSVLAEQKSIKFENLSLIAIVLLLVNNKKINGK